MVTIYGSNSCDGNDLVFTSTMSRNQLSLLALLLSPSLVYSALNAGNASTWIPAKWPAEEQFALTVSELYLLHNAVHTHDCIRSRPPLTVSGSCLLSRFVG